jgi:hypothetical protein
MRASRKPVARPYARALLRSVGVVAILSLALTGCSRRGDPTPVPTPTHLGLETIAPGDSGTNGIEHLSGADVLTESLGAIARADGVQFEFAYADAASSLQVAYTGRRGAASATIVTPDGELELIVLEGSGYLRGSGDLAAHYGATGEFTCHDLDDGAFTDFGDVLGLPELLRSLTSGLTIRRGALTDGEPPTVDLVLETQSGAAGILIVTASGEPLPIRLVLSDETASATIDITGWDAATIDAPASC